MGKKTVSSRQLRRELLRRMAASRLPCKEEERVIKKVIPFASDDAPRYLKKLARFEVKSRHLRIRAT